MYHQIIGKSLERLAALSDGLFAVAMTLLILDIRPPAAAAIHSEADLWQALVSLSPRMVIYLLSFMTLGIFWLGQQTQLSHLSHSDRDNTWIHIGFLAFVSVVPFSTILLAEHLTYRLALIVYWLNILILGLSLYASFLYARHARLFRDDVTPEIMSAIHRRIVVAQGLYAFGAALCVINTYWSIGFIFLVQLNFAVRFRIGILGRI